MVGLGCNVIVFIICVLLLGVLMFFFCRNLGNGSKIFLILLIFVVGIFFLILNLNWFLGFEEYLLYVGDDKLCWFCVS